MLRVLVRVARQPGALSAMKFSDKDRLQGNLPPRRGSARDGADRTRQCARGHIGYSTSTNRASNIAPSFRGSVSRVSRGARAVRVCHTPQCVGRARRNNPSVTGEPAPPLRLLRNRKSRQGRAACAFCCDNGQRYNRRGRILS
jgi:hypothetical protein